MTEEDKDRNVGKLVREYQEATTEFGHIVEKLNQHHQALKTASALWDKLGTNPEGDDLYCESKIITIPPQAEVASLLRERDRVARLMKELQTDLKNLGIIHF